ncbi:MAG: HlyD family efflux transporter periplasmic adaptor subunit [Bacteroidales bacterium]|nr:HlyD family efflux transporter periplasmic adaptor subunit [Bacteroidales bacterium]
MKSIPETKNTIETLLYENNVKSNTIYIIVITTIIIFIFLLPFINVSVSIQGRGFIRPVTEKTEIKINQSEIVNCVYIREGQYVNQGDTLITLRGEQLQSKGQLLKCEIERVNSFFSDLQNLCKLSVLAEFSLVSDLYIQQWALFKRKIADTDASIKKAEKEVERHKILFQKEIVSAKVYDDLLYDLEKAKKEKKILCSNQLAQWKADLVRYKSESENLKHEMQKWKKECSYYTVVSPVSGTIEEFRGIYPGSMIQSGQTIAIISPSSEIIAEVYIAAKDIGYLKKRQQVKIQVDAFNYNEWGWIGGQVTEISDDFILANNSPVFKVKCKLDKQYLQLKNGIKRNLKKGMTVNARFMVAERSLFQLLYQKADNWLNPSRSLVTHIE